MSALAVTGFGVLSAAGGSAEDLAGALAAGADTSTEVVPSPDLPLPATRVHHLPDFNVRAALGRKGTSLFDRRTGLTVVACQRAIADARVALDEDDGRRIGLVLGTTVGSAKSAVDFARETFTEDPPYQVNPALFPNTLMNCAAGQAAIWFGLRGVNATIAGGPVSFLSSLRYCANVFRCDQADTLLVGAVEELTPHCAWMWEQRRSGGCAQGEGAAIFVLRRAETVEAAHRDAEVLGTAAGFCPAGGDRAGALAGCLRRALDQAGIDPVEVSLVAGGVEEDEISGRSNWHAIRDVLGTSGRRTVERLPIGDLVGDCQAATVAIELAMIVARHRAEPARDGTISVLTARNAGGAVAAAVVRGWSRGADRG